MKYLIQGIIGIIAWVCFFIYDWKIALFVMIVMTFNNLGERGRMELKFNIK